MALTAPTNVHVTGTTQTSISIAWSSSYSKWAVWLDGSYVTQLTTKNYTFTGLTAGSSHRCGVRAIKGTSKSSIVYTTASTQAATPLPTPSPTGKPDRGAYQVSVA